MRAMFTCARVFNQDLSKWDVSRVIDMGAMFRNAKNFNQDLSNWDVSRVDDMGDMFEGANNFKQTLCGGAWVYSDASKDNMFAHSLGSIYSDSVCGA